MEKWLAKSTKVCLQRIFCCCSVELIVGSYKYLFRLSNKSAFHILTNNFGYWIHLAETIGSILCSSGEIYAILSKIYTQKQSHCRRLKNNPHSIRKAFRSIHVENRKSSTLLVELKQLNSMRDDDDKTHICMDAGEERAPW